MNPDLRTNEGHPEVENDSMENELMCNNTQGGTYQSQLARFVVLLLPLMLAVYVRPVVAQDSVAKTFSTAEEASNALYQAVQTEDEPHLEAILGSGKDVTSSGDELEDKFERNQFAEKYHEMHRLVREIDGSIVLYIGAENWPFPVPLVSSNGRWRFDSDAGRQEILFRTVGENESTAIEVCTVFAAAKRQNNAVGTPADDPISTYAQSLVSLSAKDPRSTASFHGYLFRSRKVAGRVILLAYPATYRSSGIMSFLVAEDGVVYGKDLGPNTTEVAPKVSRLDSSWRPEE